MRQCTLATKSLKAFTGVKMLLSIFFLGSSVFAAGVPGETSSPIDTQPKDLSVFVSRLAERLQGVFGELLAYGGSLSSARTTTSPSSPSQPVLAVVTGSFEDISFSPYRESVLTLASMGVIDGSRSKFYPQNYVRRYELVMMAVKYSLAQRGSSLPSLVVTTRGWFADVPQNFGYAPYVAYAEQQNLLSGFVREDQGKKFFSPNTFVSEEEVYRFLGRTDLEKASTGLVQRGVFADLLVSSAH